LKLNETYQIQDKDDLMISSPSISILWSECGKFDLLIEKIPHLLDVDALIAERKKIYEAVEKIIIAILENTDEMISFWDFD